MSEIDTDLEDVVEMANSVSHDNGVGVVCQCSTRPALALANATEATKSYLHRRVASAIHKSHNEPEAALLSLVCRHLGSKASLSICACLQAHPMISRLDLSYNSLGESGGISLVLALIPNPSVSELILAGNKLGKTKAAAYLMILMTHNHIVQKLDLSKNGFDDNDIYLISGGIMENDYVTEVDLSGNIIEETGAGYLARALAINNSLDKVNLAANCVRRTGAVHIGLAIRFNYLLTEISLRSNGLAYEGTLAIRECLLKNTFLKKLDISDNRINWEGAIVLAHGLEGNKTLHTLSAGNNPLTTTGAMDIIDAVSTNCTLQVLDLQNVNVIKEFRQVTQMIRERNPEFQVIQGHVVIRHDVLGLRTSRIAHPMHKILAYLLEKELRPIELIRIMDKTVSFNLTAEELLARCKKLGIDIKWYERGELIEYILGDAEISITYTSFLRSITQFTEEERLHRIKERKTAQALLKYQKDVLRKNLPQVSVRSMVNSMTGDLLDKLSVCRDKEDLVANRLKKSIKNLSIQKRHQNL